MNAALLKICKNSDRPADQARLTRERKEILYQEVPTESSLGKQTYLKEGGSAHIDG